MGGLCFQVLGSLGVFGVLGVLGVFVFKTPQVYVPSLSKGKCNNLSEVGFFVLQIKAEVKIKP